MQKEQISILNQLNQWFEDIKNTIALLKEEAGFLINSKIANLNQSFKKIDNETRDLEGLLNSKNPIQPSSLQQIAEKLNRCQEIIKKISPATSPSQKRKIEKEEITKFFETCQFINQLNQFNKNILDEAFRRVKPGEPLECAYDIFEVLRDLNKNILYLALNKDSSIEMSKYNNSIQSRNFQLSKLSYSETPNKKLKSSVESEIDCIRYVINFKNPKKDASKEEQASAVYKYDHIKSLSKKLNRKSSLSQVEKFILYISNNLSVTNRNPEYIAIEIPESYHKNHKKDFENLEAQIMEVKQNSFNR